MSPTIWNGGHFPIQITLANHRVREFGREMVLLQLSGCNSWREKASPGDPKTSQNQGDGGPKNRPILFAMQLITSSVTMGDGDCRCRLFFFQGFLGSSLLKVLDLALSTFNSPSCTSMFELMLTLQLRSFPQCSVWIWDETVCTWSFQSQHLGARLLARRWCVLEAERFGLTQLCCRACARGNSLKIRLFGAETERWGYWMTLVFLSTWIWRLNRGSFNVRGVQCFRASKFWTTKHECWLLVPKKMEFGMIKTMGTSFYGTTCIIWNHWP